ncbi:glycosyltransferase [Bavariicoccus seileri]|uniref:glycosyltransferase n=1 Tax=Bavariicoccus seileri TaxID=549685 RepID=UPI0003B6A253|nr:hypothetical protein [Bavariicoccus seileri]
MKVIKPPLKKLPPLSRYPIVTVIVPAHNESLVIKDTIKAIYCLNYPESKLQLLIY